MCELLALSSRFPTSLKSSLSEVARHRGVSDGWGVAFYDAGDVRLYKEPEPAAESQWLALIQQRHAASSLIIAHFRHATRGVLSLPNTQPFSRELGGRVHVFAHNGQLDCIDGDHAGSWQRFRPLGETDSEIAFCILLERLTPLWQGDFIPSLEERLAVFTQFAADMRVLGPANMIYSDGDALFVHGHRRIQQDGKVAPPGLWRLSRHCDCEQDGTSKNRPSLGTKAQPRQEVMLFASVPLTNGHWLPLAEGEVLASRDGRSVFPTRVSPYDGDLRLTESA